MEHIDRLIHDILHKRGNSHYMMLVRSWSDIMGTLAEQTRLESLQEGTLVIGVYQPQWMQELHFFTHTVRDRINQYLEADVVQSVQFKLVSRRSRRSHTVARSEKPSRVYRTMEDRHKQMLEHIKDDQLRHVLEQVYYRCEPTS